MNRTKEIGRIQFTLTLPISTGLKVYEMAESLGVGANKVLQEMFGFAIQFAKIKRVGKNTRTIVFEQGDKLIDSAGENAIPLE